MHGRPVPLIPLGSRSIPAWCARTRFEGEVTLLSEPYWPGTEACEGCVWFRGREGETLSCAAPEVELGMSGLCLEVDVFRKDGRKRRGFVAAGADVPAGVRALMKGQGLSEPKRIDVKFVVGEAASLNAEPDAFMERWRFYWNGEDWVRKPPGAPLHDWNKWGPQLEFLSVAEPGGMPPEKGWPAVLDLPEGTYTLRVLSLSWTVGRRGEPELEWAFRVLEGAFRNRKVFRRSPVRTPAMEALVIRDLSIVLARKEAEIVRPGAPGFEEQLGEVKGVAMIGRVARREVFTNLYLDHRAAQKH